MNFIFDFVKKEKQLLISICFLLTLVSISFYLKPQDSPEVLSSTEEMVAVDLDISPPLDFSLFSPYTVTASSLPGNPSNVKLNLSIDLGDNNQCWDYFVDGTCASETMSLNMTYDQATNSYKRNVYPDQIYPEIFFAPSSTTWGNQPLNTTVRRNDYHILHFSNPFTSVSDMSFWIEFNTSPISNVNSADLQIYLISKNQNLTYFNSDWRNSVYTELVGTTTKGMSVHHTHSANSSHYLVRLATDSNGKVGNKALDVSGDFWLVLFSNSPNNDRGWNLRYHPTSLCNNTNRWYRGNLTGWATTFQEGCPDVHMHISRRNINAMDTIKASVSATYDSGTFTSPETTFSFIELPNLAPNATSFINPIVGSKYSDNLNIQWNPATDPNTGDTLTYNIYITPTGGAQTTLVSNTQSTSYTLDTTLYEDNGYTLQGAVCDLALCTSFGMDNPFYIDNVIIPETISSVGITSSNSNLGFATSGDNVSITFQVSNTIPTPQVLVHSGGNNVANIVNITEIDTNQHVWEAEYEVSQTDTSGQVTFEIFSNYLDKIYFETTDSSNVVVDLIPPTQPTYSLTGGIYLGDQTVSLTSDSNATIRYTLDNSDPTCSIGTIYSTPIAVSESLTLKSIACDILNNASNVSSQNYDIRESLDTITLSSSNISDEYAKETNLITLYFVSTNTILNPTVVFSVESQPILDEITIENISENNWVAYFNVSSNTPNGLLEFSITSDSLFSTYTNTTDTTNITIDTQKPTIPLSNISSGVYSIPKELTLVSSPQSTIRYTLNGDTPSCTTGNIYLSPITIATSKIVSAISCDSAGNISELLRVSITIFPDIIPVIPEDEDDTNTENSEDSDTPTNPLDDIDKEEPTDSTAQDDTVQTYSTLVITEDGVTKLSVFKVRILDNEKNPLQDIPVTIYSTPQEGVTNELGIVTFNNIPFGLHTIKYTYLDHEYAEDIEIEGEHEEGIINIKIIDIVTDIIETENQINSFWSDYSLYMIGGTSFLVLLLCIIFLSRRKSNSIDKRVI